MAEELESDLYADLYGNDDGDAGDNDQSYGEADTTTNDDKKPTSSATTAPIPSSSISNSSKPISSATTSNPIAVGSSSSINSPYTTTLPAPVGNPIQSFDSYQNTTQSIPTYTDSSTADARSYNTQSHANGAAFQGGDRSVRPSEMKDEGKMFIGGLNWDTTDATLRQYFEKFGKVDACTIMRDGAGRSRCFAFLTFASSESVDAVMAQEHVLDGKMIDPKRAIPRQEHQKATKLFIGGLAATVTSDSMREFFSQFGKVIDSTVMLDRETGRSKGFGFISFEDTDVTPFLGFGKLEIDGKTIDVKLAQPRFQREVYQEDGTTQSAGPGNAVAGNTGGNFPQTNFAQGNTGQFSAPANAAFDPQAIAALYTRMFQMAGGGGMAPGMMGGMNPMMGGMNPMMGGMNQMARGGAMNMGMNRGGMAGAGGGMGRGSGRGQGVDVPRGPRGAPGGPSGGSPAGGDSGMGPQRAAGRGSHGYHPYAR